MIEQLEKQVLEQEARIRELELFCVWLIGFTDGWKSWSVHAADIHKKAKEMVNK